MSVIVVVNGNSGYGAFTPCVPVSIVQRAAVSDTIDHRSYKQTHAGRGMLQSNLRECIKEIY
jgi:hypothetical protein